MEQSVEAKGKVEVSWNGGRVKIEIDVSRRVIVGLATLLGYLYAPHLIQVGQQVAKMLG